MMNIGAITAVLVAMSVPCAAQGSRTSFSVMHEYVAADQVALHVPIPGNLQADQAYRVLLESMLERSPTFRRQCQRLASTPHLTVRLNPSGSFWTRGARALTRFARGASGGLDAEISLARGEDEVELIAHEIEHVIEQIDEIDLSSLAALHDTGVRQTLYAGASFETSRAAQTGLRVAREVRDARKGD
jgi:hypothetical protein